MACEPVNPFKTMFQTSNFWIGFVTGVIVTLLVQWLAG
jgi:hypothetical protein